MAEFPALPLFTDAYLGDTTHLSTFEHGAYLLLLMVSWRSPGCCVADDDKKLARHARTTVDRWRKIRPTVEEFFTIRDGFWHQARLQNEYRLLQSRRDSQVQAGRASAVAKALKRGEGRSTVVGNPLQRKVNVQPTPTPTPTPTLLVSKDTSQNLFGERDADAMFWDGAKAYLGPRRASLIGKWVSQHGKVVTGEAISAAQIERAVDPVEYIQGYFRKRANGHSSAPPNPDIPI